MEHHHAHIHDHSDVFHSHAPVGKMRMAFLLTLCIFAVEIAGGMLSHGLALLSDAGHVLTDLAAIGLSWYALLQSEKPSNQSHFERSDTIERALWPRWSTALP